MLNMLAFEQVMTSMAVFNGYARGEDIQKEALQKGYITVLKEETEEKGENANGSIS